MAKQENNLIRPLGDDLVLRFSQRSDAQKLAAFSAKIHGENENLNSKAREGLAVWVKDLLRGGHPTFAEDGFTIVEDSKSGEIVSCMNSIPQMWRYEGIPIRVGRPEDVATEETYRHRGLVRAQFEVIHEQGRKRKELLQAITGIPYYYRLFGYEMALELSGKQYCDALSVPKTTKEIQEKYRIRKASVEDVGFISSLYRQSAERYVMHCEHNADYITYELQGKSAKSICHREIYIIQNQAQEALGFFWHYTMLEDEMLMVSYYELIPRAAWYEITPLVLQHLWQVGQKLAKKQDTQCKAVGFALGSRHPAYDAAAAYFSHKRKPYAWYVRVDDLPTFLLTIAPCLNKRIADSPFAQFDETVHITMYAKDLKMKFVKGKLEKAWEEKPGRWEKAHVNLPGLTFLQLLFGYHSSQDLANAFPDAMIPDKYHALFHYLFPQKTSLCEGID